MLIKTFEYCSLHYLNQWLSYDMGYSQALEKGSRIEKLKALKNAGGFYRIARNLPSKYDEKNGLKRYEPVLDIIDNLQSIEFKKDPVRKIFEVQKSISEQYGGRRVLSLTTKFLWIKIKQPILLYDSQARIALGTENNDLESFYRNWHEQFEKHHSEIAKVCSSLSDINKYVVNQEIGTKEYINKISQQTWFHERIFDIYLWNKGNN